MAQTSSTKSGSHSNLMASGTSTPIRISSYHGHVPAMSGIDSPTPSMAGNIPQQSQQHPQQQHQHQHSSSVPASVGQHLGQSSVTLNMGPSTAQQQQQSQQTQSSSIALSSSVTPPNSAGLRQSGDEDRSSSDTDSEQVGEPPRKKVKGANKRK